MNEHIVNGEVTPLHTIYAAPAVEHPVLSPLVGRQHERQTLGDLLARLERGRGGVLTLEGSAGIGKTRLAQETLPTSSGRWQVLWGSAQEQEGHSPYAPVIEALRKALRHDLADAALIPAELVLAIPELPRIRRR